MINTHGADAMAFCPQWIKLMDLEYHGTLLDISCGDKMLSHASHPPISISTSLWQNVTKSVQNQT